MKETDYMWSCKGEFLFDYVKDRFNIVVAKIGSRLADLVWNRPASLAYDMDEERVRWVGDVYRAMSTMLWHMEEGLRLSVCR